MAETVGQIKYDARIDTSQLALDGKKADSIVKGTGDNIEQTGQRSFGAWTTYAKVAMAAAAVATGALALKVAKTGAEYNTLQQTTRAALKTLLGGTKEANDQMDKLDAFARTSPFAKDVFIKAQQQLIGFNVDAKKVVPTLDAIQDAVAAAGGKSEDIAAITDVLARVQSQGKLSGEALERLGYYGIDAAAIIGKQMGKSGAEIRDMASKPGGIPADQVWDPLVNGLKEKYGGAADGMKNTFAGTVDRIKASFRDLSAALAAPFIDPQGGGKAVEWGNGLADTFRAIEKGIKDAQPGIQEAFRVIGEAINIVTEAIKPMTDYIRNNETAWEFLKTLLLVVGAIIGGLIVGVFVSLIVIVGIATGIIQGVVWVAGKLADGLIWLGGKIADVIWWFVEAGRKIAQFASNAWNTLTRTFGSIGQWFSDLGGSMWSAGQDIIDGLVNGISNGKNAVINKIKEIASGALDAIKKFFGIKSPSRVMAQMGDYLMEGFGQGIDRNSSRVVGSATRASQDVLGAFGGGVMSPSISAEFGGSSASAGVAPITQNVYPVNQLDLDVASRQLAYQVARG